MSKSESEPVPIVGIGASAGGLKQFERFFKNISGNFGAAFVIIQHLDPDHKSMLADIVGRYTDMEVAQVQHNERVKPDRCYVIPPGSEVTYREDGRLQLSEMERKSGRQLPIDHFFKSLSPLKNRAVAIVLTGAGSDGASGIRAIKESGGLILVQSPDSAQYDGMPLSAVKSGVADQVMKVEEMPKLLKHYFENDFTQDKPLGIALEKIEDSVDEILDAIELRTGQNFRDYKRNTVLRRIHKRLLMNQMSEVDEYVSLLQDDVNEQDALYKNLLISVTGFFRDKEVWEYIRGEVLPQLFENHPNELRIWVPGCATGEEAYTWALICMDYINRNGLSVTLRIFASDIDGDAIRNGREGIYTASVVQDVPSDLLQTYFVSEKGRYRIKKTIRQSVIFAEQNFVQNPPYSNLDVISCRNVLIYMDTLLQEKALTIFHYSLKKKGILVLGKAETLGKKSKYYKTEDRLKKVYRKINSITDPSKFWQLADGFSGRVTSPPRKAKEEDKPLSVLAEQYVLKKHVPPSLLVNERGEILYVQGRTGKYLEISTGEISTNITKIAKSGLRLPIATALQKAHKTGKEVIRKNIALHRDEEDESEKVQFVDFSIGPLKPDEPSSNLYMIILKPAGSVVKTRIDFDGETNGNKVLEELKLELDEKEEYLQKTIEELESANEELKSANEESQSANEELQSTNEELETSKEELQSINEELTSTNDELNAKVAELDDSNSMLSNLLRSSEIATVFLDSDMKIFEFTPAITKIIDLRESDKGRSIQQFSSNLFYDQMLDDARRVLKTLVSEETEVQSPDGRSFWLRIIPYRTMDDTVEGVVLTFTDFTEKKKQEEELEKHRNHLQELLEEKSIELVNSEKKYRNVAENLPGLVLKYRLKPDGTDQIIFISRGAHDVYGVSPETAIKEASKVWERVHPDDIEYLRKTIVESSENLSLWDVEHRIVIPGGKTKWVHARGVPVREDDGSVVWDTVKLDITDRKETMHELQAKDVLIQAITDNIPGYVVRYIYHPDRSEEILYISKGVERILGVSVEDAKKDVSLLWNKIYTDDLENLRKAYSEVNSGTGSMSQEIRMMDGQGQMRWIRSFSKYSLDENGSITWDVLNLDVTDSKQSELALVREEKKYADLIHSLNEGIWQVDTEGRTEFLNDKMAEMLGYTKEEMMGESLLNFLDKKGRKEFNKHRKRREKGVTETYDITFVSKSGNAVYTRISTSGVFDEDNIFTGAIAGVIDITKKIETQSELKKSEEQYKVIFENSLTPILVCDNQGQIVSFNKAALTYFEHTEEEMASKQMQDFQFERPLTGDEDEKNGVLFSFAKKEQGELKFRLSDGEKKFALYHAFQIRKDFNLSVFTDITNLKMTQEALKESERLLNETSEVARVGGWSYDIAKNKLTWTKEMYDLYDVPVNFVPTIEKVFDYYHDAYRSIVEDLWSESIRVGKSFNVELKIKTHQGKELSVRSIFKPKTDKEGNVAFIYGNTQDITDLIKARKAIIGAKQKAEEANKAKSEFLAHMSHEIRTPLNGVIGFGDLLRRTALDTTQQEYVDLVNKSARNLMEIINNILDFSKIEAGKVELEYIETNLFHILEKSVDIVSYPAGDKKLELLLKIDPDLPQIVEVDRVRLKQILANLLSNAVKFTDEGEVILEVTSEDVGNSKCAITFSVRDTGIGLSKEAQTKLFKAFSQADSATTRKYGGTGLGLIIANSLAESMGGSIKLESSEGKGSNFYFTITLHCVDGESFIPSKPKVLKKCLLVEDHKLTRTYLTELLENWGLQVKALESGEKAVAEMTSKGTDYDMLLFDQMMPGMTGLETVRELKKELSEALKSQYILIMNSSIADSSYSDQCEELNVHCQIHKPLKPRLLLRMLKKIDRGELVPLTEEAPKRVIEERVIAKNKKSVLIAEDNKVNMMLAKSLLVQMLPQCELLEAANGIEAINMTKKHRPDLILMDVRMPQMDGLEATVKIREWERESGTKAIICGLTADVTKGGSEKSLKAGMDECLSKPIDLVLIRDLLEKYIVDEVHEIVVTNEDFKIGRFDKQSLMEKLGGDKGVYQNLIHSAITDNSQKIKELRDAFEHEELNVLKEITHFLRGGALSLGFYDLANLTLLIDKELGAEKLNTVEVSIRDIEAEWGQLKTILVDEVAQLK